MFQEDKKNIDRDTREDKYFEAFCTLSNKEQ